MTAEMSWPSYSNKISPTEIASVGEKGHHIQDCTKVLQKEKDKIFVQKKEKWAQKKKKQEPAAKMA